MNVRQCGEVFWTISYTHVITVEHFQHDAIQRRELSLTSTCIVSLYRIYVAVDNANITTVVCDDYIKSLNFHHLTNPKKTKKSWIIVVNSFQECSRFVCLCRKFVKPEEEDEKKSGDMVKRNDDIGKMSPNELDG